MIQNDAQQRSHTLALGGHGGESAGPRCRPWRFGLMRPAPVLESYEPLPKHFKTPRRYRGRTGTPTRKGRQVPKKALIAGITGHDGSYMTQVLLGKGYEVHGLIRSASTFNTGRIDQLCTDPHEQGARRSLHYTNLTEGSRLVTPLSIAPDEVPLGRTEHEVYRLGAQSHVVSVSTCRTAPRTQQAWALPASWRPSE